MDYRYLNAFLVAGKHQNFTKGALELKIATSALCRQIDLLEDSIGKKLFTRTPRKIMLTTFGIELLLKVQTLHNEVIKSIKTEENTTLRIGTLQSVFEDKLIPLIKKTKLKVSLSIGSPSELIENLSNGKIDVALTHITKEIKGIDAIKIYKEIPCKVSASSHKGQNIIFLPYETYWKDNNEQTISVNSLNAAIELAKAKIGPTIIPYNVAKKHNFQKIEILANEKMDICFCSLKQTTPSAAMAKLLKEVRGALAQHS